MERIKEDDGDVIVFESMGHFYKFIQDKGLMLLSDDTRKFVDGFASLGSGCGCTRGARTKRVETLYLGIPDALDDHRRLLLSKVFSEGQPRPVKKIIFKHNGDKFDEINFIVN